MARFVISLGFRALSDDGVLLYATDNDTHPSQFISLELVRGRLVFQFDSGMGLVSMTTVNTYSVKGTWHKVGFSLLRTFAPIATAHPYSTCKCTCHVMHRARALSTKMNNDREDGHCYSFA